MLELVQCLDLGVVLNANGLRSQSTIYLMVETQQLQKAE
jgi:hypothetical protein